MREKGASPPPRLEGDALGNLTEMLRGYLTELDRWLQRLQAVFPRMQTYEGTLNPAAVAANTTSAQTFTVTGLSTQDVVVVNKPSHTAGLGIVGARVSAANTLEITFMNTTAGSIDPPAELYTIVSIRR